MVAYADQLMNKKVFSTTNPFTVANQIGVATDQPCLGWLQPRRWQVTSYLILLEKSKISIVV